MSFIDVQVTFNIREIVEFNYTQACPSQQSPGQMNSSDETDVQRLGVTDKKEKIIIGVDLGLTQTGMYNEMNGERVNSSELVRAAWK